MSETIVVQRATSSTDGYGDPSANWAAPVETTLTTRGVEPVSSSEVNDGRQAVIVGYRVYLPSGSDVAAGDRVVLRGATYEVDGLPADWRSPFGGRGGGMVVALKAVSG